MKKNFPPLPDAEERLPRLIQIIADHPWMEFDLLQVFGGWSRYQLEQTIALGLERGWLETAAVPSEYRRAPARLGLTPAGADQIGYAYSSQFWRTTLLGVLQLDPARRILAKLKETQALLWSLSPFTLPAEAVSPPRGPAKKEKPSHPRPPPRRYVSIPLQALACARVSRGGQVRYANLAILVNPSGITLDWFAALFHSALVWRKHPGFQTRSSLAPEHAFPVFVVVAANPERQVEIGHLWRQTAKALSSWEAGPLPFIRITTWGRILDDLREPTPIDQWLWRTERAQTSPLWTDLTLAQRPSSRPLGAHMPWWGNGAASEADAAQVVGIRRSQKRRRKSTLGVVPRQTESLAPSPLPAEPLTENAAANPTIATPGEDEDLPEAKYTEFTSSALTVTYDSSGRPGYTIQSQRFHKFGIRVWAEVLPEIGVEVSQLKPGPNPFKARLRALMGDHGPTKIIGLAPDSAQTHGLGAAALVRLLEDHLSVSARGRWLLDRLGLYPLITGHDLALVLNWDSHNTNRELRQLQERQLIERPAETLGFGLTWRGLALLALQAGFWPVEYARLRRWPIRAGLKGHPPQLQFNIWIRSLEHTRLTLAFLTGLRRDGPAKRLALVQWEHTPFAETFPKPGRKSRLHRLIPDARGLVQIVGDGTPSSADTAFWLEVDRGTVYGTELKEKLARYYIVGGPGPGARGRAERLLIITPPNAEGRLRSLVRRFHELDQRYSTRLDVRLARLDQLDAGYGRIDPTRRVWRTTGNSTFVYAFNQPG